MTETILGLIQAYGLPGIAGACVALILLAVLVVRGQLVTKPMLDEVRSNDRGTIDTLKEANTAYQSTLPDIKKSLEVQEYVLKEIQQAGRAGGRDG